MKLPKLSLRERRIIFLGGGVTVLLLFYFYLVAPFFESKEKMRDEIATKKARLIKDIVFISEKDDSLKKRDLLNKKLEQAKTKLLNEPDVRSASQHLQQVLRDMATQSGVEVSRITPQREERLVPPQRDEKQSEEYMRIPVNIEIQCMPDQLVQFLLAIRNYEKRLWIDQLTIHSTTYSRTAKEKDLRIRPNIIVSGIIKNVPEKKEEAGGLPRQKI